MKKSNSDIGRDAQRLAAELREAIATAASDSGGQQQGSAHRKLPDALRKRFVELRGELHDRGIYDPVLIRFDTATAPQAETSRIAEQLDAVAESLSGTAS